MQRTVTRRSALALLGSVAVGGCSTFIDGSFWDDPPSFDADGLGSVTDRSVPSPPDPIPASISGDRRAAVIDRVADLLGPVPEPLTAETIPNGAIREAILDGRKRARNALQRMDGASQTLPAARAAADACEHAATAAGVWAAVSTTHTPHDVSLSKSEAVGEVSILRARLPDRATDPQVGTVVYGAIGSWLATARRSTLVGAEMLESLPNPLRVGRATGDYERIRTAVDVGDHIRARYVDGRRGLREVEATLVAADAELATETEARFRDLHGSDVDLLYRAPDVDDLLSRDVPRDHPGYRLLSEKFHDEFGPSPDPIAVPDSEPEFPALTVRNTHRALAVLDASHDLLARVDDGEDLFPREADAVRTARDEAIEAVEELADADSALERWLAWTLASAFDEPDRALSVPEHEARAATRAYGEYVWIETLARLASDATAVVVDAL